MLKVTDEQLVTAIMTHISNRKAAAALGISERQFYNRTSSPAFKEKLTRARGRVMDNAVALLTGRMNEAIGTMVIIMRDEKAPPQTRLNAASAIMGNVLKLSERTDILERLDALEDKLEDDK